MCGTEKGTSTGSGAEDCGPWSAPNLLVVLDCPWSRGSSGSLPALPSSLTHGPFRLGLGHVESSGQCVGRQKERAASTGSQ